MFSLASSVGREVSTLKDTIMWEGSDMVNLSADEARFLSAVAAANRGTPMLGDAEYNVLKEGLEKDGSWVVARRDDTLGQMGMMTFTHQLRVAQSGG